MAILNQPRPKSRAAQDRARAYSGSWHKLSRSVRLRQPICQMCAARPSELVDHIVPLAAGGAKRDRKNLQALCRRCHGIKTEADKNKYPEVYRRG